MLTKAEAKFVVAYYKTCALLQSLLCIEIHRLRCKNRTFVFSVLIQIYIISVQSKSSFLGIFLVGVPSLVFIATTTDSRFSIAL